MENTKKYKIYSLPNFTTVLKSEYDNYKYESIDIKKILKKLESNKGYNLRIEPNERCVVYGDYDHTTLKDFEIFLKYVCIYFQCEIDDISYTSSKNDTSFHFSIPTLETTPKNLKEAFKNKKFDLYRKNKVNSDEICIDLSVYDSHWLRLPEQTLSGKPIPHKVIRGKMEDFIVDYIVNCEFNFNDDIPEENLKQESLKQENKSNNNSEILKCLECLNLTRCDDFDSWKDIALIINNELGGEGFDIFNEWSKHSSKYDENKVKTFYNNIKPKENGLKIGTLKKFAKEDNLSLYKKYFHKPKIINDNIEEVSESKKNYDEKKEIFEKNNFKVINPIMFITVDKKGEVIKRCKQKFKDVYQNSLYLKYNTVANEMRPSSFLNDWLIDPVNRTYDKIDFLPMQKAPEDIYNTFSCYEASKKELIKNDIENSLIIKHIKNLCNNDDDVYDYVIKFLARKLQQPYNLTNTALIFKSSEGAGKDLFFNWFGNKILGSEYYYNTEKPELLFGKFTSILENKILIVLNETSGKDTYTINENIKCSITAAINTIEYKGIDSYTNTNHIGYVYLTNNDNPVKVPADDRRFCCIECNNNICNDVEYFTPLRKELTSGEYDKAFYNFLMSVDCAEYDFTNSRPTTNFYKDLQELNKPVLITFLENLIIENINKSTIEYQSSQFFINFNSFIETFNYKYNVTLTKFIIDIKKIEGIEQKRTRTARMIILDVEKIKLYLIKKYKVNFEN